MIQLSKKMLTFVPSVETDWQHRGELLSFDPSENIYTCRCELISFLYSRVFQNLQTKECREGSHSLCVSENYK